MMIEYDDHALAMMAERGIAKSFVEATLENPDNVTIDQENHRALFWKCLEGRNFALRVITPSYRKNYVITAYFDRRQPCG